MLKFIPKDPEVKRPSPWQRRKDLGFIKALWRTIKQVLSSPSDFFQNLEITDSFLDPLFFYLFISIFANAAGFLLWVFMTEKQHDWLTYLFMILVAIPSIAILNILFMTFLLHFLIKWFNGTGGIKNTFNIVAYGGAANIFHALPFLGGFLAIVITFFWTMAVYSFGIRKIYRFSNKKSFFLTISVILIIAGFAFMGTNVLQNYSKAIISANESVAITNLRSIALALESFAQQNKGTYPKDIYDLKAQKSQFIKHFSAYNATSQGYAYLFHLSPQGYDVIAGPLECGFTGTKVFRAVSGGALYKGNCKLAE